MKQDINMWKEDMDKKYGWHIDFLFDDPYTPYAVNIHTHGLPQFGHPDMQICYPLSKELAFNILVSIGAEIKSGKKFVPAMKYSDFLMDYDVEIAQAEESGRIVMRIIFPDKNGNIQTYDGKPNPQFNGCKHQYLKN